MYLINLLLVFKQGSKLFHNAAITSRYIEYSDSFLRSVFGRRQVTDRCVLLLLLALKANCLKFQNYPFGLHSI
jgi:hypothetical protein